MKFHTYTFKFKGGKITVKALDENAGKILAQAVAIRNGWDYAILKE